MPHVTAGSGVSVHTAAGAIVAKGGFRAREGVRCLDARNHTSNIEIIFSDYLDAIRRGDMDTVAARLAPKVTHRGVRAELVCPDRESVLASCGRARAAARPSTRSS